MLKKLNIIFIALVSFLVFYIRFNEFNESYAKGVYDPSSIYVKNHEDANKMSLHVDLSTKDTLQEKKEYIISIVSKINRPAALQTQINPVNENYLTYIMFAYGPIDIFTEGVVTVEGHENATNYYISNDISDPRNTHLIAYLDDKYYDLKSAYEIKTVIRSIESLVEETILIEDNVIISFIVNNSDKESFVLDVSEVLKTPLTSDDFHTMTHTDWQGNYNTQWYITAFKQPRPILYISSVSLLIILLLDFKNNNKEIAIRKLHGNKNNTLFRALFLRTILMNVSALFLTLGLSYIYFIGTFSSLSYQFLRYITPSILLFSILLIGLMAVFYTFLCLNNKIVSLKKSQQHSLSYYASLLIKVICVLILSVPLIDSTNMFFSTKQSFDSIKNDQFAQKTLSISFLSYDDANQSERNKKVFDIIDGYKLGLRDMSDYGEIKMNESFGDAWEYDPLFSAEGYNLQIPFIMMNHVTINNYTFMDENNKPIVADQYKDTNWVLAPTAYRDEIIENGIKCFEDCEIVYYQNKVTIDDLGTSFGSNTSHSKLIYVMNQYTDAYNFEFGITAELENGKMTREVIDALNRLQLEFSSVKPNIIYGSDLYKLARESYSESLISMIIQIVLTLFLISVFVYTYLSIYFDFKAKELVIKYLNGITFEKRYFHIFLTMIISNMLTVMSMLWLSYQNATASFRFTSWLGTEAILQYALFVIMIESLVLVLTIVVFQQKKTNSILKGEGA